MRLYKLPTLVTDLSVNLVITHTLQLGGVDAYEQLGKFTAGLMRKL